jgi:hypothetical protein
VGITQIVSVVKGKEELKNSMENLQTSKIVFLSTPHNVKEVIEMRNHFAIQYKIPTEIRTVGKKIDELCRVIHEYENPTVHLIDHDYLNYSLVNAAVICGAPVYFSNGHGLEKITTMPIKTKELISDVQIEILEEMQEGPLTVSELAERIDCDESMLYYYLHGKNSLKGLVNLGLVKDGDMLELTEMGRSLVNS